MSEPYQVVQIAQSKNFKCIGSSCEDTCCAGWSVPLDEISLNKWKAHEKFPILQDKIIPVDTNKERPDYKAIIKLNPLNKSCIFLDDNKLCSLQNSFDHDFLGFTCRKFPREENMIDGIFEKALSLSCPEAARLILSSKNGLDLEIVDEEIEPGPFFKSIIKGKFNNSFSLRQLALSIIQNRKFKLKNRIIFCGLYADSLSNVISKNSSIENIIEEFEIFLNNENDDYFELYFKENNSNNAVINKKISLIKSLSKLIEPYTKHNNTYEIYFNKWNLGLSIHKDLNLNNYKKDSIDFINNFPFEYILENYLFSLIFSRQFPIQEAPPTKQFFDIATKFYLLKEHLIGIFSLEKNINEAQVIRFIQCYSKIFEHNEELQGEINKIFHSNNISSLADLYIILNENE